MKYKILIVILVQLLIATACSTTEQKPQAADEKPVEEGLNWSIPVLGREWVTGFSQEKAGEFSIVELVLKGETVHNWSELITIQNFANTRRNPRAFFEGLKALREKECPDTTTWNVIEQDERSILYEWRAKPCAGFPEQHEISRIIDGKWNRFRIAYTAKVSEIPAETRQAFVKSMSNAAIVIKRK
ncbi:MAG: hypothetical protein HKP12_06115 [Gammaproteobacteria bacterium]|nr:hypothetical protein [Gammaproteobacteria bacterium]NNJ96718.1 hypothetical protein [Gammaproteobacteria bacterium]